LSSFGFSGTIAHAVLRGSEGNAGASRFAPAVLTFQRHDFVACDSVHPFIQWCHSSNQTVSFASSVAGVLYMLVADHVVQGRVIFPGVGYLEMGRAASHSLSRPSIRLQDIFYLQPLATERAGMRVACVCTDNRFEVHSYDSVESDDASVHCSGVFASGAHHSWQHCDHALLRACLLARASDAATLYDGYNAVGLQYGPGYRTLTQVWPSGRCGAARLRVRLTLQGTQVHPADLDDATCLGAVLAQRSGGSEARLPFAVDVAELMSGTARALRAVRASHSLTTTAPHISIECACACAPA
jgi:acyl transferase domain-containing protein